MELARVGAGERRRIVLYAGPIRGPETLWRVVAEERVTAFGTSPAYLQMCEAAGFSPKREFPFEELRRVFSTGSVLYDTQFDWVQREVGALPVLSISGGTASSVVSSSATRTSPSTAERLSARAWEWTSRQLLPDGSPAPPRTIGELVCKNPFPSRPLGFAGDVDGSRFHEAYFRRAPRRLDTRRSDEYLRRGERPSSRPL